MIRRESYRANIGKFLRSFDGKESKVGGRASVILREFLVLFCFWLLLLFFINHGRNTSMSFHMDEIDLVRRKI